MRAFLVSKFFFDQPLLSHTGFLHWKWWHVLQVVPMASFGLQSVHANGWQFVPPIIALKP